MKESVTKFDFESAFKALDEIDIPVADKGIKANRPALTEIFSRKSKFDTLFEEYYDIGNTEGLDDAKAAREAEVAKAKLDRIEKIVDLEADSPEDLLTSYVGKYIMQCPQCMTLFYKDKEDIVESEDDPSTVNVSEVCQHCGNESGYTLVGKVGEAESEASAEVPMEEPAEELDLDIPDTEDNSEEVPSEDDMEIDLDAINLDDEPVEEEEKTEEAFTVHTGETLVEEVQEDKDIKDKLDAHNEYIEYLMSVKTQEEEALEKATNEQVKAAIQRRIEALTADLENALPDEVKNELAAEEAPVEDVEEPASEETSAEAEEIPAEPEEATEEVVESLTESLHEEADLEVSADEFEELINSPEFKKPISDAAARAMMNAEKEEEEDKEVDESLEEGIFDKLKLTRAGKAEWVLANAKKDYNNIKVDDKGKLIKDDANQKFSTFVIYCFKDKFENDKKITSAPKANNPYLVLGRDVESKQKYADAENLAKGWSTIAGNGPAMIFMAKNASDDEKTFVCQYFKGELDAKSDQLQNCVDSVKNGLDGAKKMAKGNAGQPDVKELKASEVKKGMQIRLKDESATIEEIKTTRDQEMLNLTLKFADGDTETRTVAKTTKVKVVATSIQNESLASLMTGIEELQEASLENFISNSLIEAYGNVAGFKLTACDYLNEKLNVNGTIYFTSGNTRKTTYSFSEAYIENDNVKLCGLNEKLGLDKKFTLTGKIDTTNKTFITESFGRNK